MPGLSGTVLADADAARQRQQERWAAEAAAEVTDDPQNSLRAASAAMLRAAHVTQEANDSYQFSE